MKKQIKTIDGGTNHMVDELLVNRLISGDQPEMCGPFVLLDHIYPAALKRNAPTNSDSRFDHPGRGVAIFSVVLNGGVAYCDSKEHNAIVHAPGAHWIKTGNGIIYNQQPFIVKSDGNLFHSLQFWINLPPAAKTDNPAYISLQPEDIPAMELPDHAGVFRVLIGEMGAVAAPVRSCCHEFIYHIHLYPKAVFNFQGKPAPEYAAFIPASPVLVNGVLAGNSQLVRFETGNTSILFENPGICYADILIFGGLSHQGAFAMQGPFVMNNRAELATAYRDFFEGKYGKIKRR
jgi:redox-sensitive bicupin YhaK (pirin superfamily)